MQAEGLLGQDLQLRSKKRLRGQEARAWTKMLLGARRKQSEWRGPGVIGGLRFSERKGGRSHSLRWLFRPPVAGCTVSLQMHVHWKLRMWPCLETGPLQV